MKQKLYIVSALVLSAFTIFNLAKTVTQVNAAATCIVTIFGVQYNVAPLQTSHTGGNIFVCGTDMTTTYQSMHGTDVSRIAPYLYIVPTSTPTPTVTPTAAPTVTPTASPTPTVSPTGTPTVTPTVTPTPSADHEDDDQDEIDKDHEDHQPPRTNHHSDDHRRISTRHDDES